MGDRHQVALKILAVLMALVIFALLLSSAAARLSTAQDDQLATLQVQRAAAVDPTAQALLDVKIAAIQAGIDQRSDLNNAPTKPADPCSGRPTALPAGTEWEPHQGGIIFAGSGPFHAEDVLVNNLWTDWINGWWTQVFAGASGTDADQGLVVVLVAGQSESRHLAPAGSGSLTITAANGHRLTLQSASGETLYFDAAARQFATSLNQALPTLIPLPTFTPTPPLCP
ncbi:MAG TPA: hypothetical protein PKG95_00590 [Anaerolineaceae bacterium]|jgi:type II secretory pathway pseudopilin PulG|nr:hypothetical protein [Anaerolineaceae bacterium]